MSTVAPKPRKRFVVLGILFVLLIGSLVSARFYTDVLWFREVGFSNVLWTSIRTQLLVAVIVGLAVAAIVWLNLWIAAKTEPAYRISLTNRRTPMDEFEKYREAAAPYLRWIRLGGALFIGLIAGAGASASWETFLLWSNRVRFGRVDPQFGRDIGFYMFELPFLTQVLDWVWFALMAALVLSIAAHFFNGSIRPEGGLKGLQSGAVVHISVLLGLLALVKSVQYWLGQYQLNFSERGVVTGASYTDVNAQLLALKLLAIISVISALLFIVNIRFRSVVLPLAAVGIWILTAFLAGALWPWAIQRFSVQPQEVEREAPFIARNIEETNFAFGLTDVETQSFPAEDTLEAEGVRANADLLENVRLWDPPILGEAYSQLQAIKPYYEFPDVDVDRYEIDGKMRQVLLSGRELSLEDLPEGSRTWSNLHFQYTHGYGLVASLANEQTAAGQPSFLVKDVPGTVSEGADALLPDEPRLYYGEVFADDEFSIVNSGQEEIDYPTQEGVERSNYEGEGGIRVGGFLNQVAFAIRETDPNLVLSNLVTGDSKILLYRNIRDRVARAAPFLSLDRDPYPAVVEGKTVWILDGYTTSEWFPYGQRLDFDEFIPASNSAGDSLTNTLSGEKNYIRNSVKIVVDAYDGTMKFYIIDDSDPLIKAWQGAFPDLFTDEEPPEELQAHFRYPEDLFTVQTEVFRSYHVKEPNDFYAGGEEWQVAATPDRNVGTTETSAGEDTGTVSPSYLLFELPEETEQEFVLARPFTPSNRNNMISMMVARSDGENYGELLNLEFPSDRLVPGPVQVDNLINQDVETSQTLTLLGQEGSDIRYGKQVILPIEDSLLYVQPLFVTADSLGIPELKKVAIVMGEEVVLADTFDEGVAELFELDEPTEPGEPQDPTDPQGPGGPDKPDEPSQPGDAAEAERLLDQAANVYAQMQQALEDQDLARYAELEQRLGAILERANRLSN